MAIDPNEVDVVLLNERPNQLSADNSLFPFSDNNGNIFYMSKAQYVAQLGGYLNIAGISSAAQGAQTTADLAVSKANTADSKAVVAQEDIENIETVQLPLKANLLSPSFTGTPSAPTPAIEDNTTKIATTEFVKSAIIAGVYSYNNDYTY